MNNKDKIYVVHEYGAMSHYLGLIEYAKLQNSNVVFYEFGFVKKLILCFFKRKPKELRQCINSILFMCRSAFMTGGRKIVLGIAPYDIRLVLLLFIFRKDNIYIHNSWPNWNSSSVPKSDIFGIKRKFWKYVFDKKLMGFFSVSYSTLRSAEEALEQPIKNASVVYHTCEDFWFQNFEIKLRPKIFIYVGRIDENKGITKILDLANDHIDFKFSIVGSGKLDHLFDNYKGNNIVSHGYVSDRKLLRGLYSDSRFLLMPSIKSEHWEEAFGLAIIEAMSRGVIPITTNHSGPREILTGELSIFISEEANYKYHVDNIILNLSDSDIVYFSKLVRKRASDFNIEKISIRWQGIKTWI
ncbi:glycosyltransferase [Vibrio cyclitrophicus]|nr:glycosyltransferase family 4 protein [Vibrio cyclitrophicus]UPR47539.1 glycosyltransferase [Vibrio cyclitrophicus]